MEKEAINDINVFEGYDISEKWMSLLGKDERSICPKCLKSRKYFCYTCYIPMPEIADVTPQVKLPIAVDIIKHPREIDGKSTAIHAAIISPEDVNMYTYPSIPNYNEMSNVVLVFPGKNSSSLTEVASKMQQITSEDIDEEGTIERGPFSRVIFIDSTWNQCRTILNDSRIKVLPCIILGKRASQFWRHQKGSPRTYLATIEAIHQFIIEYNNYLKENNILSNIKCNDVSYDNLLFFFRFMYHKIHTLYQHEDLLSYKRPMS